MFRKPRDDSTSSTSNSSKPSTGRPPTPPNGSKTTTSHATTMSTTRKTTKPLTPRPTSRSNVPTLGRQGTKKLSSSTTPRKPNGSILQFFKKVDNPTKDDSLFISPGIHSYEIDSDPIETVEAGSVDYDEPTTPDGLFDNADVDRYNEGSEPSKRRKISNEAVEPLDDPNNNEEIHENGQASAEDNEDPSTSKIGLMSACNPPPLDTTTKSDKGRSARYIGGFVDDSDSDEESAVKTKQILSLDREKQRAAVRSNQSELEVSAADLRDTAIVVTGDIQQDEIQENRPVDPPIAYGSQPGDDTTVDTVPESSEAKANTFTPIPALKQETTSFDEDYGGFDDIENFQDFDDEFGEEFEERKWMEEQAALEAAEELASEGKEEDFSAVCPICDAKLTGVTTEQVSRHVNACLDGNPIKPEQPSPKLMPAGAGSSRFSRASIAKPGQANPFTFGDVSQAPSSAFSKLMASHAEDAAWATAAAAEQASRGKPAYQRTCPFYKIMPGFYICVDAFRYGAVQGCNAYFLSHFHSDHYIGLTSNWSHGPIYCSKVTANLVKQQLRVDPKWVVALEFEKRVEVPQTQGVTVTMIPANHCPGSSLFLFEKVVGKGSNPKIQRVLHCGDFRACPAHISHPLLMPDIVDSLTGKMKQQKIDVCYLDTTYLNPRYAFPSQEDVIKACADMCVSLKKERAEDNDAWETVKRERMGGGMAKFVGASIKSEDSIAMEVGSTKARGRLLVVCGTYSIGKERICMGIARALDCKIWAPPGKQRICAALEDPELMSRLTDNPLEAQIHMQMLMEIRAETLQDYLNGYKPHFSRIVGFRPSGWNYRPPNSRFVESPAVQTVLMSENWKSRYSMTELTPQRGSTREASCFGVPYSEHSSFRELTMFCCALRIEKIIPTVNVGSAASRGKMKVWTDRWLAERRKNGVLKFGEDEGMVRW